jgi:polar amino acid transport system substrate-binding protein
MLSLLCASARGADIPVTIYADAGYPPYSYDKNGKPAGLYYEIVRAAASQLHGYKVEIQTVPWKRGMALLRTGTGFALYPPYMNTKDEPWTWPYSLPLYEENVVAVCRKEVLAKPRKRWPDDFYGLTIGNNAGFIVGGDAFDKAARAGLLRVEEGKDSETNIIKLGLRRIDCYINDRVSIQWTLNQLKAEGTRKAANMRSWPKLRRSPSNKASSATLTVTAAATPTNRTSSNSSTTRYPR